MSTNKYLVALPTLPGTKGFNCPTILVKAVNVGDAIALVRHLRGNVLIGDIKEVDY